MSEELEVAKFAWKCFLGAHAAECDTDAFVDEVVSQAAALTRKEMETRIEKCELTDEELAGAVNRKADEIYIVPARLILQAVKEKILEALK